ncbi:MULTISPECIES: N-acetylmuramoyl-L-alanine amidase [Luteibacter]|jgi:N-acetylmuramoyl-L-alanine amidase|uniref:N-acetylmuramoyl-L-alanine amidase n=1 Tax=Luteibacter sp. Lutesp34 TaxID=3243030 RepID=UPI0039B62799
MIDILHAPLPYESRLPERLPDDIDLVVIHCTELPDLAMAREYGERVLYDSGAGNSGHYYIDRDGSVLCYVDPLRVAHHTRGYNPRSIGIELVNTGRYPDWFHSARQTMTEPYPERQIAALRALLDHLVKRFPSLRHIAGHEDLDTAMVPASDDPENEVPRKRDPGPQFPWSRAYDPARLGRLTP